MDEGGRGAFGFKECNKSHDPGLCRVLKRKEVLKHERKN